MYKRQLPAVSGNSYSLITKNGNKMFSCEHCNTQYKNLADLRKHIQSMHDSHNENELKRLYGEGNPNCDYLEEKATRTGPSYFHCRLCKYKSTSKQGISTHITKKHKGHNKADERIIEDKACKICKKTIQVKEFGKCTICDGMEHYSCSVSGNENKDAYISEKFPFKCSDCTLPAIENDTFQQIYINVQNANCAIENRSGGGDVVGEVLVDICDTIVELSLIHI